MGKPSGAARRWKAVRISLSAHGLRLMSSNPHVRSGRGRADEREAGLLVLWVVAPRIAVFPAALENTYRAREIPALLAQARQDQSSAAGGGRGGGGPRRHPAPALPAPAAR